MKVKFTRDYAVQDGSGKVYKEGDLVNFVDASARHFVNRGAAVEVITPVKPRSFGRKTTTKRTPHSSEQKAEAKGAL